METIGERVIRIRLAKGWNQAELVKQSKVGQSTVVGVEKGSRNKAPSSLIEIAHALGVDAYWLKTGIGEITGKGRELSDVETLLLKAYPLLSDDLKESWCDAAKKAIERNVADKAKAA
ncbi:MAG: helix-turn-helix transcriptional regulator [Azonexus sp.]